ncbi:nucleotidyl transferase AbiEii/AbiGii toxin family protein [Dactylosporangium sp. NBC_01737]|uniref:nucleotidyl transferase AbiEii/AbiGii toxin family protein n=1 Tax=Dactylosporangium sp. NBC_01737 TaxID=2975959 RepID=UPI002E159C1D|nr:nucleotidyl transferase AbiEii/AbiGii toxin family protein [Dactylosporangium sp. NBC_01737]
MAEIAGTFEIHLTVGVYDAQAIAGFAERHGAKFVHILLDRGQHRSQPMLTVSVHGTLDEARAVARKWQRQLVARGTHTTRVKIEAAPWCGGVPQTDAEGVAEPPGRYFEHHVKLALPVAAVAAMRVATDVGAAHGARLSRNARRRDGDGRQERFLTQRCYDAGLATATQRLDGLVAGLRAAGLEVVEVEQEYVVEDSNLAYDHGWLDGESPEVWRDERHEPAGRAARAGAEGYPPTYLPLPAGDDVRQTAAFDPALKQYRHAYRAGEPTFADHGTGRRWQRARRAALDHVLGVIARSRWAGHLVLRGSVTMAAWVGEAAREPGDLDYVVTPPDITSGSPAARELLDGITAALTAEPGAGLQPERTVQSAIWTYERADGRRLAIPFRADGVPGGTVQVDLVFGEHLPMPPEPVTLPGADRPVLAAPAPLALAWKLLWLLTDSYPQGKDLYDAALLAEHTTADLAFVRDVLRPELGEDADTFTAERLLSLPVDWPNFTDEYGVVGGTAEDWRWRLALTLERAWT